MNLTNETTQRYHKLYQQLKRNMERMNNVAGIFCHVGVYLFANTSGENAFGENQTIY